MAGDSPRLRELRVADIESLFAIDVSRRQTAGYVLQISEQPPGLLLQRRESAEPISTPTWGRNECRTRRELWRKNLQEGARMWGTHLAGALAGFVLISPPLPDQTVEVLSLFVDASRRRAGIGSSLLRQAEEEARGLSAVAIHLSTTLDNAAAIDFYLRCGYRVVQLSDCATTVGGFQSAIRLAKRLS